MAAPALGVYWHRTGIRSRPFGTPFREGPSCQGRAATGTDHSLKDRRLFSSKWQIWFGVAVSVALLVVLLYQMDLGDLKQAIVEARYAYVAPAVLIYFGAVFFRAVRWRYLLMPLRTFPVMRLYPVVIIGYMANNLLPVRLGEVVRAYYLGRQENFSTSSALGSIAAERLFDGLTLLALTAFSAPWLLLLGEFDGAADVSRTTAIWLAAGLVAVFGGFLVFFTLLVSRPEFANLVEKCLDLLPGRTRPAAVHFFRTFVSGMAVLRDPRKQAALAAYSVPVWLMEGAMYLLIAYSFNLDAYFTSTGALILAALLLTAISNLATAIPSAVGGIGPFELGAQQTLVALGVGASVAGAYAGFVHLAALWLPVNVVGLVLLWKQNLSLRSLVTNWRQQGPDEGLESSGERLPDRPTGEPAP